MKRLTSLSFAAAMAMTVLGSTAALAQSYQPGPGRPPSGYNRPPGPQGQSRPGQFRPDEGRPGQGQAGQFRPGPGRPGQGRPGQGWHQWHRGDRYNGQRNVVRDWHHYRLRQPPPGYQWVQNGSQFVLIGVATGIVTDIILNGR